MSYRKYRTPHEHDRWQCPSCRYLNLPEMKNCMKRCGTRRPEVAKPLPPNQTATAERVRFLAENNPLYRAILQAKTLKYA